MDSLINSIKKIKEEKVQICTTWSENKIGEITHNSDIKITLILKAEFTRKPMTDISN